MAAHIIARGVAYAYGLLALTFCGLLALTNGALWKRHTKEEEISLRQEYHNLWLLTSATGYNHDFVQTSAGYRIHYLSSQPATAESKALIIFLHGFPDSCHLFSRYLTSPLANGAILVSLDLPGCGGSDGVGRYDAVQVMNIFVESIFKLKHRYLAQGAKCVLVGHDWGGILSYRIAAEAGALVDRVIVLNTAHPPHVVSVVTKHIDAMKDCLALWMERPWQIGLLREAWQEVSVVGTQLIKSNYIFMFNLPYLKTARWFPSIARYLLEICHQLAYRSNGPLPTKLAAHTTAVSNGPSTAECTPNKPFPTLDEKPLSYGQDVLARARLNGDWDQRIRLYREGLATGIWLKDPIVQAFLALPTRAAGKSETVERRNTGRFTVPVTVLFGLQDPALDPRLVLDGIEGYFCEDQILGESHVVRLPRCGHWTPVEEEGRQVLERVLEWALESGPNMGSQGLIGSLEAKLEDYRDAGAV